MNSTLYGNCTEMKIMCLQGIWDGSGQGFDVINQHSPESFEQSKFDNELERNSFLNVRKVQKRQKIPETSTFHIEG